MDKQGKAIILNSLEELKDSTTGLTWGVPWEKGRIKDCSKLVLKDCLEQEISVQSWPMAYWPDGSLKWTAHAAFFEDGIKEKYYLSKGRAKESKEKITLINKKDYLEISTGKIKCQLNRKGRNLIKKISNKQGILCSGGYLECVTQQREENKYFDQKYISEIEQLSIENNGPIRCLIKVVGRHKAVAGKRKWLPFILRLYFYLNSQSIKITLTHIFDGDKERDFIKSLGFILSVPLSGNYHNRQIRFVGDSGVFAEAVRLLPSLRLNKYLDLYQQQIEGKIIEIDQNHQLKPYLEDMAVWNSFKLVQDSADHYYIKKRTKKKCSWITAVHGNRSKGLAFLNNKNGGLAAGLRDFWEKYPSSLELDDLSTDEGKMRVYFWAAEAGIMDLRHYDTETHLLSSYEGFEELRSSPYGIANTNELTLSCFNVTPTAVELLNLSEQINNPQLLVCTPEYYHNTGVFGKWSLSQRNNSLRDYLENILTQGINFYKNEIEQRKWYGFWDYGDIMHSYDPVRHNWRYDMGGYAWQNSELVPDMWLWYSFLRTGRRDIFRLAENMTRHTSEVDIYHLGEYAGLGSRHNVLHWGCGCKEVRISMAGLRRYYFYLTADERTGEIMDEVKDVDFTTLKLSPMREIIADNNYPTYIRSGPDWIAFCSNWLVQWERYQDNGYKEKILEGIKSLKKMPYGLCSGPTFGYQPKNGRLFYINDENYSYHMIMPFGGLQVCLELNDLLEENQLEDMLIEFGEFYNLTNEEKKSRTAGNIIGKDWVNPELSAGITAFSAAKLQDSQLVSKSWSLLLKTNSELLLDLLKPTEINDRTYINSVNEIKGISTNFISQWSLNMILALELIDDYLI